MADPDIPPGHIRSVITHLEMRQRPTRPTVPAPEKRLALMRADPPTLSFYRYLYDAVGREWQWVDRKRMTDDQLKAIVQHPLVEIYVLHAAGTPAGFAELDLRRLPEIELAYFGLVPECIGRGLGWYLLNWAIDCAWNRAITRLWVHTCDLDHPRALGNYQRAGFAPYMQESQIIPDPRAWANAALKALRRITIPTPKG
jgi:GNAT superfamily N-acetyltransferase